MRCRCFSLGVFLTALTFFVTGCMDGTEPSGPIAPPAAPAPGAPPVAPAIAPPPEFPALSRAGQIYRGPDSLYDFIANQHGSSVASRYVLYDDGTFGLQFASLRYPFFEYTGRYLSSASEFNFDFDGGSGWYATGSLRGDSLIVKYNLEASMSDFADGVYVRSPGP